MTDFMKALGSLSSDSQKYSAADDLNAQMEVLTKAVLLLAIEAKNTNIHLKNITNLMDKERE